MEQPSRFGVAERTGGGGDSGRSAARILQKSVVLPSSTDHPPPPTTSPLVRETSPKSQRDAIVLSFLRR